MSDDRVIQYLRTRARVEPERDLVTRIMSAVDEAPPARSPFALFLPAVAIAGAVAVVIALAIVVGQRPNVGPDPNESVEPRPSPATIEELTTAVTEATRRLADSEAVEGTLTFWIEEYLASAAWWDWRTNGDQVVVTRHDIDVQAPWWTDPEGAPLSVGERIEENVHVLLGADWYRTADGSWLVEDRSAAPRGPLTYGIGMLTGQIPAVPPTDETASVTATSVELDDGSQRWVLQGTQDGAAWAAEWRIDPDGALATYSVEGMEMSLEPGPFDTATRATIEFAPVRDPEPIPLPGRVPDPDAFGLPEDFPLSPGD